MIDFSLPKLFVPIGIALALNLAVMVYPILQDADSDLTSITIVKGTVCSSR